MTSGRARLLALAALVLLVLAGCAGGEDGEDTQDIPDVKGGKIAVLLPDAANERWEAEDRRTFEQAFGQAGVDYIVTNAEGDASQQQIQADQALANGAKVLVLVNLDSTSGADIVEKAHAQGAAVIDYDRLTTEGEGADFHVGFDDEAAGRLLGDGLAGCLETAGVDKPHVALLSGASPTVEAGLDTVLKTRLESGEWKPVGDEPLTLGRLQREEGVDGVLAATDKDAGAVLAALPHPVAVTGDGATVEGVRRVLAGEQCLTVHRPIHEEAAAAADLAIALVKGTEPTLDGRVDAGENEVPAILLKPVAVTRANVGKTVVADGSLTWDEICSGEAARDCPPAGQR